MTRGQKNPLHLGFADRLRKARRQSGLTRSALSIAAGMAPNTLYGIESGERMPRLDTVERLATALGLSPCLLAFGVEQPCESTSGLRSASLYLRLGDSRHEAGLSLRDLSAASDTSVNFVRTTETGATVPSLAKAEALAQALGVAPCWLAFGIGPQEAPPRRRTRAPSAAGAGAL